MTDLYLQMVLALILVGGLIFLLGHCVTKKQGQGSLMTIMGYQSLGPKKGLALVKVGRETILVGVTATDIKLLKNLDLFDDKTESAQLPGKADSFKMSDSAANLKEPGILRFEDELEGLRAPEKAGRVIVADASTNLKKLKALKDYLVCS
jgi:flagellar biogenesis protein FliO